MEDVNKRRRNFFSFSKLECSPQEINSREICLVDIRYFRRIGTDATKSEKKLIHFQSDVFAAVAVIDTKAPYRLSRRSHVFVCEQKPYPVWFSRQRKSYSVECEQSLSVLS